MDEMRREPLFGPGVEVDLDGDLDDSDLEPGGGNRFGRKSPAGRLVTRPPSVLRCLRSRHAESFDDGGLTDDASIQRAKALEQGPFDS